MRIYYTLDFFAGSSLGNDEAEQADFLPVLAVVRPSAMAGRMSRCGPSLLR